MGVDMELELELELDQYCNSGGSPETVLQSPQNSCAGNRKTKGNYTIRRDRLRVKEDFKEISFQRYRTSTSSCKSVPYQSSNEMRKMKKTGIVVESLCSSLDKDNLFVESSETVDREMIEDPKLECDPVDVLREKGTSLSAKLALPHSPSESESDSSKPNSPKARFRPIRKMFDPFMKSKFEKNPLCSTDEPGGLTAARISLRKKKFWKTLLNDLSNSPEDSRTSSMSSCSPPMHLQGSLKLKYKHGAPLFEFSLKFPDEVFVAKTWKKADNSLNWTYTFESDHNNRRRKSDARGWGFKGGSSNKESSSMVGFMQVSAFENYMMTEFVLYDTEHAKNNTSAHQWNPTDLCPSQEIAAIIIKVPFFKRRDYERGDEKKNDEVRKDLLDCLTPKEINVVIPTGNHSLPSAKNHGPSPLIKRWKLGGGGCDCGGWDVACPLLVFGNSNIQEGIEGNNPLGQNQQRLELFLQGAKKKAPALTIAPIEEGLYSVDFHAQLSALQVFSICVAILHSREASISARRDERYKTLLQCSNPLRVSIKEDEVKYLIESDTAEEERRKLNQKIEETSKSFVLNPPFSPIGRV